MIRLPLLLLLVVSLMGCESNNSSDNDHVSDTTTSPNSENTPTNLASILTSNEGLSSKNVHLTVDGNPSIGADFQFAQDFYLVLGKVEGFKIKNGNAFPGMRVLVISESGDTVMLRKDLYQLDTDGINYDSLDLKAGISITSEYSSGNSYTIIVDVWDKKGSGRLTSQMNFNVVRNEHFDISVTNVEYREVIIASPDDGNVLLDNKIRLGEQLLIVFEGITGFKEIDGLIFADLNLKATDATGKIILDRAEIFAEHAETGFPPSTLEGQVNDIFSFTDPEIQSPIDFEATVWDRKSDAKIVAKIQLELE